MNLYFVLMSKQNMATNMERYGVQNIEFMRRVRQTNLQRYGNDPLYLNEIRRHARQTNLQKYGPDQLEDEEEHSLE